VERTNGWPGSAGEHRLQEEYGTTDRAERFYSQQVLDRLNEQMREFVGAQEMMFVATSDAKGECDNTFRAGPPGFVRVLGDDRLAWPEYRGNGVMASLGNISENPNVGLLFMDFFRQVIGLHVNGHAEIVEDADMRSAHPELPVETAPGRRPERWVVVTVEEAYIHCAKHIPRLAKLPRERDWGTDDFRRKGGDFFGAAAESRPWRPEAPPACRPAAGEPAAVSAGAPAVGSAAVPARLVPHQRSPRHEGMEPAPAAPAADGSRVEVGAPGAGPDPDCTGSPSHREPHRGRRVLRRLIGRD
jgi:predicted pyridoxine 5'-phosphate oxidase superfamily flavin-nucleotide-binding protein